MSDPFRSELEAAHARIEKLERDHKARVEELERENARLRSRLVDVAPSRSKTGKTFLGIAMMSLAVSIFVGMLLARTMSPPQRLTLAPPQTIELADVPTDNAPANPGDFDIEAVTRAFSGIRLDDCAPTNEHKITGHATITISPTGMVNSVHVDAPYAGTALAACIEQRYRSARVPPFSEPSRIVGKRFTIQ